MKTAIITGASSGLGREFVRQIADIFPEIESYWLIARRAERLEEMAAELPEKKVRCISLDLCDNMSFMTFRELLMAEQPEVTLLVNCAGCALPQKLFTDTSDEEYHHIFNTNVLGTMRLTKLLTKDLRHQSGSVVNISSMWGISGGSCEVIYSASKAALIGFTKALAKELAPCGVTVNAVAPGFIQTAMNAHLSPEDTEAFRLETPLERLGTPEDVADAVFYLANARFVTGQVLCCDGGYTL